MCSTANKGTLSTFALIHEYECANSVHKLHTRTNNFLTVTVSLDELTVILSLNFVLGCLLTCILLGLHIILF